MTYAVIAYLVIGLAVLHYGSGRAREKGRPVTFGDTLKGVVWCVLLPLARLPLLVLFGLTWGLLSALNSSRS